MILELWKNILSFFCSVYNEKAWETANFKISFAVASEKNKHFRINLTKKMKDLYSENYKTLMEETEGDR